MNKIGRPKNEYDINEVNEIITKKLKSIDGDISKLSYHTVNQFNKLLVMNKVKNYQGKLFTDYGTYFWSGEYLGEPSFGKERIDFYKKHKEIMPMGELYDIDLTDIELIFSNNKDNIETIKRRIMKVFKKERSSNANNEEMFIQMQKELQIQKALVMQYKEAIYMMFYNSQDSRNSLDNVISLKITGDKILMQEINNIFDSDTSLVDYIYLRNKAVNEMTNNIDTNIINIAEMFSKSQNK